MCIHYSLLNIILYIYVATYIHSFLPTAVFITYVCIIFIIFYSQVNINGIISLDFPFTSPSPNPLPLSGTNKIIAPYWGDVDTRGTGQIFYRQTNDPNLLDSVLRQIQATYPLSPNVTITNLFIATWDAVGYYYMGTDQVNWHYLVLLM